MRHRHRCWLSSDWPAGRNFLPGCRIALSVRIRRFYGSDFLIYFGWLFAHCESVRTTPAAHFIRWPFLSFTILSGHCSRLYVCGSVHLSPHRCIYSCHASFLQYNTIIPSSNALRSLFVVMPNVPSYTCICSS
ncbi:uncharacterized protein CC84DRAFT_833502 [Paraphaeosphaeria sporulosa]|uniref:Uncharacterized protein n=1 Tax=Paraphaeosphaeria sporulosa TaxID=1460663 RepID=A0A177CC88_9PLEO|nr:uncharacterized protein CC84DRAFT_833502 [Paraphaeosphaeria sporulosa]OAG05265.1 hypothetical protein CC84DRAFT_833502 [Paraphaeosphaeria sporulosa]